MKKKIIWVVIAVLAAVGILVGVVYLWIASRRTQLPDDVIQHSTQPSQEQPSSTPELAQDPVDWEKLHTISDEIYAYIEMPQAKISYPIVQHAEDDSYYLRRDVYGNYSVPGSIFTEYSYNGTDFNDPVTLVYGHAIVSDGSMFGSLQAHMQSTTIDETTTFTIYLPGRQLNYQIFAAVPHDKSHILYYNDFTQESVYTSFFENILQTHSLYANVNEEYAPEFGDRVVILSTCLDGGTSQRYVVMGKLVEEIPLA